jgi:hypothetical protein
MHQHSWNSKDLSDMLRHQLYAPMHLSMGTLSGEITHHIHQAQLDPMVNLQQLLQQPAPPLELLKLTKRFAKMCRRDPHNPLPSEIVMLLYYLSIAAAMVRLNQSISDLPPASLTRGMTWLGAQQWVPNDLQMLLFAGLEKLQKR